MLKFNNEQFEVMNKFLVEYFNTSDVVFHLSAVGTYVVSAKYTVRGQSAVVSFSPDCPIEINVTVDNFGEYVSLPYDDTLARLGADLYAFLPAHQQFK
jgi:hypothetical protein